MLKRTRVWLLATFAIVLVTMAPASALFAGQAQTPENLVPENIVDLAQKANMQVKNLIDSVYADDEALQKITEAIFSVQLEGNVSLYNQGVVLLTEAETALENKDYDAAISSAREALQTFRQVFKSINWILVDAGLKTGQEIDATSLLDAANRTLIRIAHLRELLPFNATDQIALLDQAQVLLNLADLGNLILEGKSSVVADNLREASESVSQVYQYLKLQAEESNTGRICGYLGEMEQARERLRERFRYADSLGLNVNGIFESLGYHNETEFMNALQNMAQNAQGEMGNFTAVMNNLEVLGQMVQQMNQTLTQEMNRYQGQHGSGGNGNGSGYASESPGTNSVTSGNTESGTGVSGYGSGAGTNGTGTASGGNGSMSPETSGGGSNAPSGTGGSGSGTGGNGP
jgi:tetratricopeptide (TPR) repeat protein